MFFFICFFFDCETQEVVLAHAYWTELLWTFRFRIRFFISFVVAGTKGLVLDEILFFSTKKICVGKTQSIVCNVDVIT